MWHSSESPDLQLHAPSMRLRTMHPVAQCQPEAPVGKHTRLLPWYHCANRNAPEPANAEHADRPVRAERRRNGPDVGVFEAETAEIERVQRGGVL